jgi:glycine/D-amino acid oxidase-like deaminating enzyme
MDGCHMIILPDLEDQQQLIQRLRADLLDPPGDVQEAVLEKLGLGYETVQDALRFKMLKLRFFVAPRPGHFMRRDGSLMQTEEEALDWLIAEDRQQLDPVTYIPSNEQHLHTAIQSVLDDLDDVPAEWARKIVQTLAKSLRDTGAIYRERTRQDSDPTTGSNQTGGEPG